ncbi:uracil permease [Clostridium sp. SYSU_GA19001]|uniref:uracil permease n=1 Tax=Clostridium caldaquaticum TaxID=2940653 RepID=UPI002076E441|nr:uracil permease [Clostridium caldaquaticum]MCM8711995.1 uracil permease [Clostridium caldaquaticum]
MKNYIDVDERLPLAKTIPLSLQHLCAMFGATILVPILFHINPAIALLMNGIGTLLYTIITKGKIPAYLGSSFAFIAPVTLIISTLGGFAYAQTGFIFFGLFFVVMSFIIKYVGVKWIDIVMPPAVMGSVVAVIGLELAPVAAQSAGLIPDSKLGINTQYVFVSIFTLLVGVIGTVVFKKFLKVIPILIAVVAGYVLSLFMGMVDTKIIADASWFALPKFQMPKFSINAILIIAPACLVVLAEHISHLIVTGNVVGKDLMKEPGLDKSLLADGVTNILSGFAGSPPNTTYGENIGVLAITRVFSIWVIRGAAILAIILSCIGKVAAIIQAIPSPVMGGITLLLYGIIAISGLRMLVESKVDFSKNYNMVLAAVTFGIGVSGATIHLGSSGVELKGMAFAAVAGMVLSLVFYILSKLGLLNEEYKPVNNNEDNIV